MILKQHIDTQQFLKPFVIPQTTLLKQGGSYTFFALEPSTKYQVRIQACNKHGWGSFSDEFLFMTTSIGTLELWDKLIFQRIYSKEMYLKSYPLKLPAKENQVCICLKLIKHFSFEPIKTNIFFTNVLLKDLDKLFYLIFFQNLRTQGKSWF